MGYILFIFLAGTILSGIIAYSAKAPGRELQRKFVSLGTLTGKTKDEIISVAGSPNSVSASLGESTILQWIATGYHISLIFDGEVCRGISHEFASR